MEFSGFIFSYMIIVVIFFVTFLSGICSARGTVTKNVAQCDEEADANRAPEYAYKFVFNSTGVARKSSSCLSKFKYIREEDGKKYKDEYDSKEITKWKNKHVLLVSLKYYKCDPQSRMNCPSVNIGFGQGIIPRENLTEANLKEEYPFAPIYNTDYKWMDYIFKYYLVNPRYPSLLLNNNEELKKFQTPVFLDDAMAIYVKSENSFRDAGENGFELVVTSAYHLVGDGECPEETVPCPNVKFASFTNFVKLNATELKDDYQFRFCISSTLLNDGVENCPMKALVGKSHDEIGNQYDAYDRSYPLPSWQIESERKMLGKKTDVASAVPTKVIIVLSMIIMFFFIIGICIFCIKRLVKTDQKTPNSQFSSAEKRPSNEDAESAEKTASLNADVADEKESLISQKATVENNERQTTVSQTGNVDNSERQTTVSQIGNVGNSERQTTVSQTGNVDNSRFTGIDDVQGYARSDSEDIAIANKTGTGPVSVAENPKI